MQDSKLNDQIEYKSRTQTKNEAHDITSFGKKLIELNSTQIQSLPLDEKIIDSIMKAKTMSKIALKRQLQYIGKLLRASDLEPVYALYDSYNSQSDRNKAFIQRIENLRIKLISSKNSKEYTTQFISNYPNTNVQLLRQLIRNAQIEFEKNKLGKSYKELFQFLKNQMTEDT